jgi:hypothetical protein
VIATGHHMHQFSRLFKTSVAVFILVSPTIGAEKSAMDPVGAKATAEGPPVLWRDPVDIASRNLLYGPGGNSHEPQGTFTFDKEDMQGSNPKFDVVDQYGVKWRVKLGDEARPETVASRLIWAVGYFANEDYFVPVLHVQKMPHLHRGSNLVSPDGTVRNVRLKRHLKDQKKIGEWSWKNNPFVNTRELNGLRVLMAVINNWDLKDANNSIYQVSGDRPEQLYLVSDLGSSFGSPGLNWAAKGNLSAYAHSKLIGKTSPAYVNFNVPAPPKFTTFIDVPELTRRMGLVWLGHHIPVADARWMGHLLGELSPQQIRDAFRAAGYSPEEVEAYGRLVEQRIVELEKL